ncbi:hypothetical protein ABZ667_42850 [Streptomyces lavendulae]|uniref:hypothetical protein n=1 Tax=Streptomyces lavendulae TaxID=1914 RepID=UPI0033D21AA4
MSTGKHPRIHVELLPASVDIKNLRTFVREFCIGDSVLPEGADQVAMTTSELLENATKYASMQWAHYDMRLLDSHARVSVTNSVTAEQRETLISFIAEVGCGDALGAYTRCLERQSLQEQSQAGLARIRYEASAELTVSRTGNNICLLARIPIVRHPMSSSAPERT